jgi:hypothetical protein
MHHAMLEGCTADKCADGMDIMLLAGDSFFEKCKEEEHPGNEITFSAIVIVVLRWGNINIPYAAQILFLLGKKTFLPLYSIHRSPHLFTPHYYPPRPAHHDQHL